MCFSSQYMNLAIVPSLHLKGLYRNKLMVTMLTRQDRHTLSGRCDWSNKLKLLLPSESGPRSVPTLSRLLLTTAASFSFASTPVALHREDGELDITAMTIAGEKYLNSNRWAGTSVITAARPNITWISWVRGRNNAQQTIIGCQGSVC
jgi:hypothetical protein